MSTWNPELDVVLTDSSDDEDVAMKRDFRGREALMFVVDANLNKQPERMMDALKLIRGACISGMMVNDKDLVGIMFANTKHSPEPLETDCLESIVVPANCAVFLPLRQLNKPIVEHYLNFMSTVENDFDKVYGIAENGGCGNYAFMLRLCIELFEKCGYKLNNAKMVYLTDRATPHAPQSREYQAALQKASDLEGKSIEFHVIPMIDDFDYNIFYKEFLSLVRDLEIDSFQVPDAQLLREILEDRKLKQDFLRRCLGNISFSIGPDVAMSVRYYNYFQRRAYPKKVKVLRKDNVAIQKHRAIMVTTEDAATHEITEEQVKTTGGWHEINLGNMSIRITTEQLNRVRNLHAPGMMLLGFKHKSSLPFKMYSKPSNFMYPDEQTITGTKRLFRALWQRCLERDKIAICLFMCKRKSQPRYVALVPVEADNKSTSDRKGYCSLLSGDGFKIVYLPAAKHIRQVDLSNWNAIENTAPVEGVELFEKVVKKLRVDYQPSLINDPHMEKLVSHLLALAFDIKVDSDNVSLTNPEEQDKRIEKFMPQFEAIFGAEVETAQKSKRTAKSPADGTTASKMKKIDETSLQDYNFVMSLIADKGLLNCTAVQLRTILDDHFGVKLSKTATKAVMVERITDLSK